MTSRVLVSLGSNIEPEQNLPRAVRLLLGRARLLRASRLFATEAVGEVVMDPFLNAAVELETNLEPGELKYGLLRPIETELGRERGRDRNAPRTLDLDIAIFGDRIVDAAESGLTIPDPEILTRAHVAVPLADAAPETLHPVDGRALGEIARAFERAPGVRPADDPERLRELIRRHDAAG